MTWLEHINHQAPLSRVIALISHSHRLTRRLLQQAARCGQEHTPIARPSSRLSPMAMAPQASPSQLTTRLATRRPVCLIS